MHSQRLVIVLIVIAVSLLSSTISAASNDAIVLKGTPIVKAIQNIGQHFGVIVIVDPLLKGSVNQTIDANCGIEDALKRVLEPLGYFYSKVDDYYLVGGPASPLAVFADAESSLIPVGFLDKKDRNKLEQYQQYVVYDAKTGMLFIKAPTSMMNRILSSLWDEEDSSSQLNIIYSFRVIDLAYVSDFDLYFQGGYTNQDSNPHEIIVNSEQIASRDGWSLIINKKIEAFSLNTVRQPWVSVLPGKTLKMNTTYHWATTREDLQDRKIIFEITPSQVDELTGRVVSNLKIGEDEPAQGTALKSNLLLTTIRSGASQPQVVALVRSFSHKKSNAFLGRSQNQEIRDYAVLMTVYPLRMQKGTLSTSPVLSAGDFAGLDTLLGEPVEVDSLRNNILMFGISGGDGSIDPWLNLDIHINKRAAFNLEYIDSDVYSLGVSGQLFSFDRLTLELLAGDGVGPDRSKALLLGFGDKTVLSKEVSLFAQYYPFVYLSDEEKAEKHGVWHVGTRIEGEQLGISCMAIGDTSFEGWDLRFSYDWGKYSLSVGGNIFDDESNYFMGWGFKL